MEKEPRKASLILLELEAKINVLLNLVRTQDLNIKILSNKLNMLLDKNNKSISSSVKVEAVDLSQQDLSSQSRKILFTPNANISVETDLKGFRRTSRPETYSNDVIKKTQFKEIKLSEPEFIIPNQGLNKNSAEVKIINNNNVAHDTVPVIQRIVNKTGKSIFLADVEIINSDTQLLIHKTRTNGTGKWMASLPIGKYKIIINKRESLNKDKLELIQDIQIDGYKSPYELQTAVVK